MTSEEFSGVDIDLLADYVGGALSDDDEATVARLIADDPRWQEAYETIAPGMASVQASLREFESEPMPADVVARLDAALASPIAEPTPIDPALVTPVEPHLEPVRSGDRHLTVVPGDSSRPVRRRRKWRWAAPIAAAAGVLAFAGVGIDYLAGDSTQSTADSSAGAGSAAENAPMIASDSAGGLVTAPGDEQILASGTNYVRATLGTRAGQMAPAPAESGEARKSSSLGNDGVAPSQLQRLRVRAALMACLESIARENNGGPITVETVDYARFQGSPAVVVHFSAGGQSWAWASGPACGTPVAGADRLLRVRVG
jgi:anti-sigma factor RsiW